ncbi:MAG: YeeE/YedE family protein [Planctomycetes bacterium]|nr:YeeE/YedE family protein [Planctomycetota bacterium]
MARDGVSKDGGERPFLPWWAGGLALGGVLLAAVALVKPLGVSTQYVRAVGAACDLAAPGTCAANAYFTAEGVRFGYEEMVVIGLLPGAFLATLLTGRLRRPPPAPAAWTERFGPSAGKRILGAALGGALLLFGARLAGGCTSGHILSGVSQMAVSSLVFGAAAFGTAVLASRALYGTGRAGGGAA